MTTVAKILNDVQDTVAAHRKCYTRMRELQEKDPASFFKQLMSCMQRVMLVSKQEPAVDRVIKFFCSYVAEHSDPASKSQFVVSSVCCD
jgi:hypothetical protein